MIFEFIGLPGTGKTVAVHYLHDEGIAKRVLFKNKIEILFWFFMGVLFHPLASFYGCRLVFAYKPDLYTFWNHFIVRYARIYKADFFHKQMWVIDEPPMQNFYSLTNVEKNITQEDLNLLYTHLFSVGLSVHFSLEESTRLQRVKTRARDLKNELDEKQNQNLLSTEEYVVRMLSEKPDAIFVRGDTTNLYETIKNMPM